MGEPNQPDRFYITAENLTSRSSYAFSNFDFGSSTIVTSEGGFAKLAHSFHFFFIFFFCFFYSLGLGLV